MLHGDTFVHHHPDMAIAKAMKEFLEGRPRHAGRLIIEAVEDEIEGNSEGDDEANNQNPQHNELDVNAEEEEQKEGDEEEEREEQANEEVGKLEEELFKEEGDREGEIEEEGEAEEEGKDETEAESDDEKNGVEEEDMKLSEGEGEEETEEKGDDEKEEKGDEEMEEGNDEKEWNGIEAEAERVEEELIIEEGKDQEISEEEEKVSGEVKETASVHSKLAGLQCDKWGGPSTESAAEMVYWSDIPSDQKYVSPFRAKNGEHKKYMTFEPDGGGWNNIRMAMETVVGLAIAMGRTLVLPPAQGMYLLGKDKKSQNTDFSFAHFFPMLEMAQENDGLEIITMEEFLLSEAMTGKLVDKLSREPSFPPYNRTNWDGQNVKELKEWLRNVTYIEHMWKPEKCLAAFPASVDHEDILALEKLIVTQDSNQFSFAGNPADVDGPPLKRLQENLSGRSKLCIYDEAMQEQLVVHFMCYHKMRIRYLVHFYAFLFFEDWKQDLWMKRFMRDHMRYMDEIQCAAARVVEKVRERSRQRHPELNGAFDSFHIRRGDFQYKTTRISANDILRNSKGVLHGQKTVFIATDERDKSFFQPLKDAYDVVFLDDYLDVLKDVNSNYYGMIDQLVAAKGDVFFGCWFSTFTGFINRMRGYYSVKLKLPGYQNGTLPTTYYYATIEKKLEMHVFQPLKGSFFNREFPTSWRQIDKGIEELQQLKIVPR